MGQVGQVIASLEHGRVHQRRQSVVLACDEGILGDCDRFLLYTNAMSASPRQNARAQTGQGQTYLAILELEDERGLTAVDGLADELRGYPALGSIGLPGSRANIVSGRHGGATHSSRRFGDGATGGFRGWLRRRGRWLN